MDFLVACLAWPGLLKVDEAGGDTLFLHLTTALPLLLGGFGGGAFRQGGGAGAYSCGGGVKQHQPAAVAVRILL